MMKIERLNRGEAEKAMREWIESAFEQERHCDHSDCENISVLRHFCHYRSGASACSATHTGRDEDHACVWAFEHALYFLLRLLGCGISLFRLRTGAHKEKGNGLGLALVKKIVDLEGGTITVANNEEKGCTFTVILNK